MEDDKYHIDLLPPLTALQDESHIKVRKLLQQVMELLDFFEHA